MLSGIVSDLWLSISLSLDPALHSGIFLSQKRAKQKTPDDAQEYSRAAPKILSVVRRAPEKQETLLQDREKASARRSSRASSAGRTEQVHRLTAEHVFAFATQPFWHEPYD